MHFDFQSEHAALIHMGNTYTYLDLWDKIQEYNKLLSKAIKPGTVVVIPGDYSFENIALFFSLYQIRSIIVPIAVKAQSEFRKKLQIANASQVVSIKNNKIDISTVRKAGTDHEFVKLLHSKGHAGLVLFSSGSTGEPKAMVHDLNNIIDAFQNKKEKNFVFLIFLMFDHIGGINTLFHIFSIKACMVIPESRKPLHIAELVEKYNISVLPCTPTFLNLLLISEAHLSYDLSSLRLITYGTEPMSAELLAKIKRAIPHARFMQTFGTSETGIVRTSSQSAAQLSIKIDKADQEYKIVDGELWLKSKTRILGYLNYSNSAFTEDGWFRTGDLAQVHEDGFITITGRKSEIINVGGEKAFPAEIESALMNLQEISDCIVYGEDNPLTGQIVVADVILKDKTKEKLDEIKGHIKLELRKTLDKFKIPRKINIVDHLDHTENYKKKRI